MKAVEVDSVSEKEYLAEIKSELSFLVTKSATSIVSMCLSVTCDAE